MFGILSHMYICDLCKKKFQLEDIRYSNDGRKIVCLNCYNNTPTESSERKVITPTVEQEPDIVKIICVNCNYKFSLRKRSRVNLSCPYCGKDQLIKDNITADKVLQEISNEIEGKKDSRY